MVLEYAPIGTDAIVISSARQSEGKQSITSLLLEMKQGNREVESRLASLVYSELRRAASRYMRGERIGHTLQPTALVNEAWLRLMEHPGRDFEGRAHFFAVASRVMRQILVDHARRRIADKRGGGQQQIFLSEIFLATQRNPVDILALDQALERFRAIDERAARVLELNSFGGLSFDEIALVIGVSTRTVRRDWSMARAWLHDELSKIA
jgi:RNA polymerase sigma factor (TIGR02999 family)